MPRTAAQLRCCQPPPPAAR
uniref:Uncharacterized protein n=1 Tax=Zea mays TaxID=4577 RepID=C4J7Z8_MAIZE|nr:unknown [Zea mays]